MYIRHMSDKSKAMHFGERDKLLHKSHDIEIINQNAERLNTEASDVLTYQIDLWRNEDDCTVQNDSIT